MSVTSSQPRLRADAISLAYNGVEVVGDLSLDIPDGAITCIVGANASGKSTVLKAMARLLVPTRGAVLLDGQAIHRMATRVVATHLGILPQSPTAPDGITVADLVSRGRHPHHSLLRQWSRGDEAAVADAMRVTDTLALASRQVDELSGGQRQRVWIAMALAQGTQLLLLDEPTTYLDLAHQIEVLELLRDLNRREGRTVVLVLHDLNQAARYSDHLVAMAGGRVVASGPPGEVITADLMADVFGLRCHLMSDPVSGAPMIVPIGLASSPVGRIMSSDRGA